MKDRSSALLHILLGLTLLAVLSNCALPLGPKESATPDHAFISYWPAKSDSGELRLAVKDIIDMKGEITTAGSQYLAKNSPPAKRDAKLLGPARRAGVKIIGKTNLTELALGTTGANEFFGTPRNPLDRHRIPGGSSSGSAVAVANNEADVAFGSDSAGSIRIPAACCGIFGLKTTFGLVPLKGVFPLSPKHLDTVGPMTKDVPNLVKGMDLLDPGFSGRYEEARAKNPSANGIRLGRFYVPGTDPKIDRAVDRALTRAGFQVVRLDDRFKAAWDQAQSNGSIVAEADAWLSDRQYIAKLGVAMTTQATIQLGEIQYNTAYKRALAERRAWQKELSRIFHKVDFIALPTLKKLPPHQLIFERSALFEARVLNIQNTVAVNYAGNPAIAIPIRYQKRGFPLTSLQLVGPKLSEAGLVNAARMVTEKEPGKLESNRR
jgi:Asp-tRNA(Asn)/Glu-tRNA(Gln) amidotransferase A subunit family amidase